MINQQNICQAFHISIIIALISAPSLFGQSSQTKPNIIMFLVDDLGWQDTSVPFWKEKTPFNKRYRTPNMERLAAQGMKFTSAYACAVCSPSRVSLMTGLNAAHHRVTDWTLSRYKANAKLKTRKKGSPLSVPQWNANGISTTAGEPFSIHAKCLPQFLREAGYRTIHVGKAHFAARGTAAADPKAIGFDINIAGHAAGAPASYYGKKCFAKNPKKPGSSGWDVPGLEQYHNKDIFLTEALTLEANKAIAAAVADKKPFFLYMAHYAVHAPLQPDPRFAKHYRGDSREIAYASLIEGVDKSLGDIMAKVEELGQTPDTVILFMSDNGGLSAVGRGGKRHTHNKPLSSGKGSNREGGIRVPMLAKWPGITKPGSVCGEPVIIEDFFASILDIAGINNPQQIGSVIDGRSFVPLLKGETGLSKDRPLFWHYPNHWGPTGPGINFCSALRVNDWKLIFYHDPNHPGGQYELFNLRDDIGEEHNLVSKYPERAKSLAARMTQIMKDRDAQMPILNKTGQPAPYPTL